MCLSTLILKRKTPNMQGDFTDVVPCGKCVLCLKRKQNSWSFRLYQENKISTSSCFLTFTYENTPLSQNGFPTLKKSDFQNFLKRLRKQLPPKTIKYYACGEYGSETHRPHYHAIMFNLPAIYLSNPDILSNTWGHGHIDIGSVSMDSIKYVTKYIMKGRNNNDYILDTETGELIPDDRTPEFPLMSKKLGISYLTPQMVKYHRSNMVSHVTLPGGIITSLPRYFRDKIFSKYERNKLNIEAENIRNFNFEKYFNNSFKNEHTWKKDQLRKQQKAQRLERQKL